MVGTRAAVTHDRYLHDISVVSHVLGVLGFEGLCNLCIIYTRGFPKVG